MLLSKAADVPVVNGGGGGLDSHSPTNPRCAAASCQRTQVCEECLECRPNLLEHFPFNCPVEPAAGRAFPQTCTEYIRNSCQGGEKKVQQFQLCTQKEINVVHHSKVCLLCQTQIVQNNPLQHRNCTVQQAYRGVCPVRQN